MPCTGGQWQAHFVAALGRNSLQLTRSALLLGEGTLFDLLNFRNTLLS